MWGGQTDREKEREGEKEGVERGGRGEGKSGWRRPRRDVTRRRVREGKRKEAHADRQEKSGRESVADFLKGKLLQLAV